MDQSSGKSFTDLKQKKMDDDSHGIHQLVIKLEWIIF